MAFIRTSTAVLSFAAYQDVLDRDQRLFEANEGLTQEMIEDLLIRSTERILAEIRASEWWKNYYKTRDTTITYRTVADIPAVDPTKIAARQNDFTDLCVYKALADYILPRVADFGTEDNAERQKMGYYLQRSSQLFQELITAGDWYDFDLDGTIESTEKQPGSGVRKRIR